MTLGQKWQYHKHGGSTSHLKKKKFDPLGKVGGLPIYYTHVKAK